MLSPARLVCGCLLVASLSPNVSSQGSMQGAAPPYIPGWAGFSGHDVYQQGVPGFQPSLSMAALAPPSALQPPGAMSGLGNLPHRMPSPWHPHLPSVNSLPVNGLQSVLPDVNGYALEKELRAASGASLDHRAFSHSANGIYAHSQAPPLDSIYQRHLESNKFSDLSISKSSHMESSKVDTYSFNHSSNIQSAPNSSTFNISPGINDVSSSSLKWKSVYMPNTNSSVENYTHSREPMSYRDPGQMSTSTSLSLPVVTSAAPQHSNVISYYSEPRDRDRYSIPAGFPSEMASREAAKILAESHVSDMTLRPQQASENRHRTSPFMNISNNVHRQHNAPPFEEIFQKLPSKLGMPNDMRPENAPQYSSLPPPSKASQSKVPDFWSQFGLPQPFMDQNGLNLQPQGAENAHVKRQYEHEHQEESLPKPSKKQKVKNLPEITHPDSSGPVLQMSDGKCKSPKSDNRRGIFAPNPEIDALVNAKVCEIMAAIKQKEKPVPTDSCETRKSPKQEKKAQSSAHSNHPTFVHAPHGETNYPANGKSVDIDPYKFPQSDEHARLSNQVMDMRMNRKGVMLENPQTSSSSRSFEPGNAHAQHGSSSIQSVVDYSIEAMICKTGEKPAPHPQPSKHEQLMHQVNEVRQIKQDHGRVSPCCGNCEQLGVQSSEHCTNHKHLQLKENMQMATHLQQKGNLQMATHLQQQKGNKQMATHLQQKGNLQMASHKHGQSAHSSDPFKFTDEPTAEIKPIYKPYKFMNSAIKSEKPEKRVFDTFASGLETKSKMDLTDKYRQFLKINQKENTLFNAVRKGIKTEKNVNKAAKYSVIKSEKLQGQVFPKKNLTYGIKSSNALLKRSRLHGVKLPNVRQKWRNNVKYVQRQKDDNDFAKKLMKNLGFKPLTLHDLVTKSKKLTLPKTYFSGKTTIASSVLSSENKTACRDRVSPKALENISHEFLEVKNQAKNEMEMKEVKPLTAMPFHRSRSFECLASDIDVSEKRFRSNSIDLGSPQKTNNKQHACQQQQSLPLVQGGLNNQAPQSCDLSQMEAISSQISDLRERVTGGNQNLEQNLVEEVPRCSCLASDSMINEAVEGPYYTHLGSGRSVEAIRVILENRTGVYGSAVRIEKLRYSGKEGKSPQGCPIAKWIVRRGSVEEKYLALVRHRVGHVCDKAWIIIGLVAWEGVPATQADHLYDYLSTTLPSYGNETERRCGTNDRKTCACQGADLMKRGASFSFGCSWSMYFNGCKFARSTHARKFRLKNESAEQLLEDKLQELASQVGPLYKQCAPDAHANQSHFSKMAQDCRLGDSGPFSGVTACVDFCAHAHKDIHNMNNGSTVVVTLTKHRGLSKPDDEQLHVLPMYVLDPTDERGSFEGQFAKIQNGSLEVLHQFPLEARMRAQPLESCKKRKMAKKGAGKRMTKNGIYGWDSSSSAQSTPQKSMDMMSNQSGASHSGSLDNTPVKNAASDLDLKSDKPVSYEDLMAMSQHTQFNALYDKFWDYFYAFGVFPPPSILAQCIDKAAPSIQRSAKLPFTSHAQLNGGMADPYRVTSEQQKFDQQHAVPLHSNIAASSQGQHQSIPQLNKPVKVENMYGDHRANGQYVENCNNKAVHPSFGSNARIGDIHQPNDSGNIVENLSSHGTIPETISLTKEHKSNQPPARGIPTENGALDLSFSSNSSKSSQPALHNEQNLHEHSLLNKHASGNEHPTSSYQSPLDMLSQAVDMRSKNVGFNGTLTYTNGSNSQENHPPPSGYFYQSHHEAAYQNGRSSAFNKNQEQNQPFNHLFAEKNSGNQEFSNTQRLENTGQHNPSAFPSHHQGFSEQVSMGPGQPNMGPHSFNPQKLACGENLAPTLGPQPEQREPSLIDPDVVKCEMEYNEAAFRDPEMGGVAIALCHGAVLFEVAKRELHATTGLRNPNRYHPTRISLVFYQHKNLNTERHGMYAYEKKLEQLKMKRIEKMQLERGYVDMREIEDSFKGGKKRKVNSEEAKEEEELAQLVQQSQAPYRYMWDCSTARAETSTSAVTSTRWVEPCPMVTGPYQKWA
ncbi:uncharacterized protein LOC128208914 isoform X2 [Mya arenaria]|uniref:uncharacterized protein LOC128208914 isoform X2 n=1 Tax=Mya arenaria TaxID=6604 RepID=UPI0022E4202D|nr:uncharacterized protein LOC128208914 isoform X2 [Mya arenaria]